MWSRAEQDEGGLREELGDENAAEQLVRGGVRLVNLSHLRWTEL